MIILDLNTNEKQRQRDKNYQYVDKKSDWKKYVRINNHHKW